MAKENKKSGTIWSKALRILNEAGKKGIRVDLEGLAAWIWESHKNLEAMGIKIVRITGVDKPGSSPVVAQWLDGLYIKGTGSSKERLQLVTGEHIRNLKSPPKQKSIGGPVEAAELIGQWRTLRKALSMGERVVESSKNDGRFYYEWKLSEKTNRLYSGIQNMGAEIRDFLLPDEGEQILVMDYQSQELRILLQETGETELLKAMDEGKDFHRMLASWVFEKSEDEVMESERDKAKTITYGVPYGQV
ncbi:MAG TPA: hypothetical protein ENH85_03120, partial [Candidatus Scalindua sp.]|nr:hypothetical protein [Candidatus Scalindua sp.]